MAWRQRAPDRGTMHRSWQLRLFQRLTATAGWVSMHLIGGKDVGLDMRVRPPLAVDVAVSRGAFAADGRPHQLHRIRNARRYELVPPLVSLRWRA